jgi:peptidoglycan/LPS O-acetylase OafA/YrhL
MGAAAPMSASASESTRYDELEAYRGLAALLIVVFHAYQHSRAVSTYVYAGTPVNVVFQNLDATVAWFFVLSGFLITLPFARAAVHQDREQSARGFLIRRAIRIVPLYYAAILLVWTLRYTGGPGQWQDLLLHLSFTQVFNRTHIFWTIGPAWSLAVEAQFYLAIAGFAPLAFRACGRLRSVNTRLALLGMGVLLFAVASLAYKWWAFKLGNIAENNYPIYYGPNAKLDTFEL